MSRVFHNIPETRMRRNTKYFYAFGPYVVDTARHLVLRDGAPVTLTPKTYDALLVLVRNSGRMLPKDELMKELWPDSFVEEANLTQQISLIRKALGEGGYIVTVPGRGYRFAAPVREWAEDSIAENGNEPAKPVVSRTTWWSGSRNLALIGVLFAIVLGAGVYAVYSRHAVRRSLAILPFQSLKHDAASDFLGFSLADAVITKLGYVNSLTVCPSYAVEKYRNQVGDIQKVAAELHVDTLLTGTFIREGDDLRITSQLIDVKTQKLLWKNTFDLKYDKLLSVQDNVAQQIIRGLALSLSPQEVERLKPEKPIDPLAYEYYLRGIDLYSRNDFPLAIKMLERSAEIFPGYGATWAHLGRSYTASASFQLGGREQYKKAQAAYERALALQPAQIEAQIYMANFFTDTGRVEQAVPLLRNALKANPNHAEAHWECGYAYRFAGMLKESLAEAEQARQLDPNVKLNSSALNTYLYLGRYDRFLESLPAGNDAAFLAFYRGFGEYHRKNWEQAAKHFERAYQLDPSLLQAQVGKAIACAIAHRTPDGLALLNQTESKILERGVGDPEAIYKIGQAYAVLGDKPSALRVLRHSIEQGFFAYPYLTSDPLVQNLRNEAEFVSLLTVARQRHEAFKRTFF